MKFLVLLLSCAFLSQHVQAANIIGLFFIPSRSHHILGEALMKGFANRGHNTTLVSAFPMSKPYPNVTHLHVHELIAPFEELKKNMQMAQTWTMIFNMNQFTEMLTRIPMESEAMHKLRSSGTKFDVLISDEFYNRIYHGLAYELGAQIVPMSPSHSGVVNHLSGNVAPYSFVPGVMLGYTEKMTFGQKLLNAFSETAMSIYRELILEPTHEKAYKKYFPDKHMPDYYEMKKMISLFLVNTHYSIESPRPYVPNMIQIGGYHVDEPKELPKDLKTYLDSAKDGFIYCALGSNVKPSQLPKEKILAFTRTFAKFPYKVLWKWDSNDVPEISSNVKTSKWLPQRDILAHPNLKVFISHGGLLSTTEAIVSGVPVVGIPFFADQKLNAKTIEAGGMGVAVQFEDLTEQTLTAALNTVIENPSYREEMQKKKAVFLDRPIKPMDNAVYWIEHIIKHKGGKHLRCHGADLSFIEYWMIDVYSVVGAVWLASMALFVSACRWCCCRRKKAKGYKGEVKGKKD